MVVACLGAGHNDQRQMGKKWEDLGENMDYGSWEKNLEGKDYLDRSGVLTREKNLF